MQSKTLFLFYHALYSPDQPPVGDAATRRLAVAVTEFRRQLEVVRSLDWMPVSIDEALWPSGNGNDNRVVFTFDDGYSNNYTLAFPALVEHGVQATFYMISGMVNQPGYMTGEQLREMAEAGMTIGSHTVSHRWLVQLTDKEIREELADSRRRLEDILGRPVYHLAIPGGHYDSRVIEIAKECGYKSVATCRVGFFRAGDDVFQIPRVEVRGGLSVEGFAATFSESKMRQLQRIEAAKATLRKLLGLRNYDRLRKAAHKVFPITR